MFCPSCGTEGHGKFCVRCGTALPQPQGAAQPQQDQQAWQQPQQQYYTPTAQPKPAPQPVDPATFYDSAKKSTGLLSQALRDVTSDPNVVKTALLLMLISIVPVLRWTASGYYAKWGARAAYRFGDRLPDQIISTDHFRMGFYIADIVLVWTMALTVICCIPLLNFVLWIVAILAVPFMMLSTVCAGVLDSLDPAFRLKQIWEVGKRNYGGLWLILLVPLLVILVFSLIAFALYGGVSMSVLSGMSGSSSAAVVGPIFAVNFLGFFVLCILFAAIASAVNLVCYRALGYWVGRMAPEWVREGVAKGAAPTDVAVASAGTPTTWN